MTLNDFPKSQFLHQLLVLESISGLVHNERFISFPNAFTTCQMSTRAHQSAVVSHWPVSGCYGPGSITEETRHRTDCSWHAGSRGERSHLPGVGKSVGLKGKVTVRTDINHSEMDSEVYCLSLDCSVLLKPLNLLWFDEKWLAMDRERKGPYPWQTRGAPLWLAWTQVLRVDPINSWYCTKKICKSWCFHLQGEVSIRLVSMSVWTKCEFIVRWFWLHIWQNWGGKTIATKYLKRKTVSVIYRVSNIFHIFSFKNLTNF